MGVVCVCGKILIVFIDLDFVVVGINFIGFDIFVNMYFVYLIKGGCLYGFVSGFVVCDFFISGYVRLIGVCIVIIIGNYGYVVLRFCIS